MGRLVRNEWGKKHLSREPFRHIFYVCEIILRVVPHIMFLTRSTKTHTITRSHTPTSHFFALVGFFRGKETKPRMNGRTKRASSCGWRRIVFMLCLSVLGKAKPSFSFSTLPSSIFQGARTQSTPKRTPIISNIIMSSSTTAPTPLNQTNNNNKNDDIMFGNFVVPAASVFYRSPGNSHHQSFAFVNLRPIVPGHVLVVPHENVPTLHELSEPAYLDLWKTVRIVQDALREQYQATAFNVAVQDGRAAGQSVPHVHVHILPRREDDAYAGSDEIYNELEEWAPRSTKDDTANGTSSTSEPKIMTKIEVPDDSQRRDRTRQEMADEAAIYRNILLRLEQQRRSEK